MKRVYIVVGENPEDGTVNDYYAVCHSMRRAEELCQEAEEECPENYYTWHESTEEDDE